MRQENFMKTTCQVLKRAARQVVFYVKMVRIFKI